MNTTLRYGGIISPSRAAERDLALVDLGQFRESIPDPDPPQVILDTLDAFTHWSDPNDFPLVAWRGQGVYYISINPELSPQELDAMKIVLALRRYRDGS